MVKCLFKDCECAVLWDTSSLVSIISTELLQQHLGRIAIRHLSELLNTNLNLTSSNSDTYSEELLVPFLVTSEKLDYIILRYNVIEELVARTRILSQLFTRISMEKIRPN